MSHLAICEDLPNVTFSQESGDGHMLCVWPDGRITNRFGQEVAHANLSPKVAKALHLTIQDTYGPTSLGLSSSENLSEWLANSLRAVEQTHGSTLYKMTWKKWATPSGLFRFRLRVSERLTKESGLTGWPTPTCNTNPQPETPRGLQTLAGAARLVGWPTPTTIDNNQIRGQGAAKDKPQRGTTLGGAVRMLLAPPMDSGKRQVGYRVEMNSGVQLNPAHSRWLMGFPRDWDECSPLYPEWLAATVPEEFEGMEMR